MNQMTRLLVEDGAAALTALVEEAVRNAIPRQALLLRLSTLPRALARPHHRRLAQQALAPLALADRARRFTLPNGDLALVWRGDTPALAIALADLAHLFSGLPDADAASLVSLMPLPDQAERLLTAIEDSRLARPRPAPRPIAGQPLDLTTLAALEAALAQADLSRFARRAPVCGWADAGFALAWEHRLLSLPELAETLAPGTDLRRDKWLYRRLSRTLDRRMLALLATRGETTTPLSLDLNAASLLTPEFLRFDATLPAGLRGRVVLGLQGADAMADPAGFLFARDFAHARGYRLALRGADATLLEVLPRARLGLDLLWLDWSPALAALPAADAGRVVLAGIDGKAALAWGKRMGVTLFAGALVAPAPLTSRI